MDRLFRDVKLLTRLSKTVRVLDFARKAICVATVALVVCEGIFLVRQMAE